MCGIAGYWGLNDKSLLERMTDVLKPRGPDDSGYFMDERVGLGMRRLSIIDLTTGKQPIHNEDETLWIVFNGEIYNFQELRMVLEKKGHDFYTQTDTEVIIHAYEEYGINCVRRLRGMFAFAIWDCRNKELILARDRLGIKPLYYCFVDGVFLFGSEIKSLLQYEAYHPSIDYQAMHDYFSYLYVPPPLTIFKDIYKLPHGHYLIFKDRNMIINRYWDVRFMEENFTEDYYINRTRHLLEDSIKLHMISDVPIGVYLSGGIDSSTLVGLASSISDEPLKTFTLGFYEEDINEAKHATEVAEFFGTEHQEFMVDADALKLLPEIVAQHDEPFGNSTSIVHYLISKYISRDVKVALSGTGGDEVFAGYPKYLGVYLADYYNKIPRLIRTAFEKPLYLLPESRKQRDYIKWGRRFINSASMPPPERYCSLVSYFSEKEKSKMYSSRINAIELKDSSVFCKDIFKSAPSTDINKKVFYTEFNTFLPYNILEYTDKTSSAASIESRVPFLDHVLVDFSSSIPFNIKLKKMTLKYVLKKSMADILPKFVIKRKKTGFNPPTGSWLDREIDSLLDEYLSKEAIIDSGIFSQEYIKELVNVHKSKKENKDLMIWSILFFQAWYRHYLMPQNN